MPERVAPDAPAVVARRGSRVLRLFGRAMLRTTGWRVTGELPALSGFVAIVAPHTSNWDFVVGVFAMFAMDLRVVWLGKDSLFSSPLGPLMRRLGGRPVKRDTPEGTVANVAAMLRAEQRFILALAPEGTRKPVPEWRTGYYHIAEATRVPILPVWLDYGRREIGLGEPMMPTGSLASDVARLRGNFRPEMARFPANFVTG